MSDETKKCPMCGEIIMAVAVKCKHCKSFLDGRAPQGPPRPPSSQRNNNLADDPVMRAVLPVGRSWLAVLAGYAGLASFILIGAPFAIILGILALKDIENNPKLKGKGRAWFGIISGGLVCILFLLSFILS